MTRRTAADKYVPVVTPRTWGVGGRTLWGGWIEIPANGAGLFISRTNLRVLADQLHDLADQYEGPDQ